MLKVSHEEVEKTMEKFSSLLSQFQNFKYKWDCIKNDAHELSTAWNIEPFFFFFFFFSLKETTLCENFFDKLKIIEHIEDKEQCFKIKEFYEVMDLVVSQ